MICVVVFATGLTLRLWEVKGPRVKAQRRLVKQSSEWHACGNSGGKPILLPQTRPKSLSTEPPVSTPPLICPRWTIEDPYVQNIINFMQMHENRSVKMVSSLVCADEIVLLHPADAKGLVTENSSPIFASQGRGTSHPGFLIYQIQAQFCLSLWHTERLGSTWKARRPMLTDWVTTSVSVPFSLTALQVLSHRTISAVNSMALASLPSRQPSQRPSAQKRSDAST